MIVDGRVFVNGIRATLGQTAVFGADEISVDGEVINTKPVHVYIILNKPRGYVTTVNDDRGRKTVMELVSGAGSRIYPVGRLDINSEGLLIFTNDGEFADRVMHPSNKVIKTYDVSVTGDLESAIKLLQKPVVTEDHTYIAENAEVIKADQTGGIIRISIIEGRNRQIRKMCSACGLNVHILKRISAGALSLGSLKPGKWRHLTGEEVRSFG